MLELLFACDQRVGHLLGDSHLSAGLPAHAGGVAECDVVDEGHAMQMSLEPASSQVALRVVRRIFIVTLGYVLGYCLPACVDRFVDRRAR